MIRILLVWLRMIFIGVRLMFVLWLLVLSVVCVCRFIVLWWCVNWCELGWVWLLLIC